MQAFKDGYFSIYLHSQSKANFLKKKLKTFRKQTFTDPFGRDKANVRRDSCEVIANWLSSKGYVGEALRLRHCTEGIVDSQKDNAPLCPQENETI